MKNGFLKYHVSTQRYHFWSSDPRGRFYPVIPLHCGDTLEVKINGKWIATCLEASWGKIEPDAYYLEGTHLHGWALDGLEARM